VETKTTVTQGVPVRAGKKRRNQLPAAIVVLLGIIIVAVILGGKIARPGHFLGDRDWFWGCPPKVAVLFCGGFP